MSGVEKTVKRFANASMGKGFKTDKERKMSKKVKRQRKLDKVYNDAMMPDEELIARNERRKAAARRGSRQRNVLTDEDMLG